MGDALQNLGLNLDACMTGKAGRIWVMAKARITSFLAQLGGAGKEELPLADNGECMCV